MTTRVANAGERIVLGIEIDQVAARTAGGLKRRVKAVCVAGDGEAMFLQEITDTIVGPALLVRDLRMRPNLTTLV